VRREDGVAKRWDNTWGFLIGEYETLRKDVIQIRKSSRDTKPLPQTHKPALKLPPLKAPKQDTKNPFPIVTSREVGWRSGKLEYKLEVYGRWGRPKYSIEKQLKWPFDSI